MVRSLIGVGRLLFLAYLVVATALPSSSIYGIPVGQFLLAGTIIFVSLGMIENGQPISRRACNVLVSAAVVISTLLIWYIVGLVVHGDTRSATQELITFFATLAVPYLFVLLITLRAIAPRDVILAIIYGGFVYCLWKIVGIAAVFFLGFDLNGVIETIFSMTAVASQVGGSAADWVFRFHTITDSLVLVLIFITLASNSLRLDVGRLFIATFVFMALASIFFAFSRLLFLFLFLFGLFWLLLNFRIWIIFLGLAIVAAILATFDTSTIWDAVALRFDPGYTAYSDEIRKAQYAALLHRWEGGVWFGEGMGAYVPTLIRDQSRPYLYEAQWISFLLKFGIVGTLLIVLFAVTPLWFIGSSLKTKQGAVFGVLFLGFLISGVSNPYLLSTAAGMIYTVMLAVGMQLTSQKRNREYDVIRC